MGIRTGRIHLSGRETCKGKGGQVKSYIMFKGYVAQQPACETAEFESMTGAGACDDDVFIFRMKVNDKMFIGCVGIHAYR